VPTKPARLVRYAEQPRRVASMVASSAESSDATNATIALRRARERTKLVCALLVASLAEWPLR